jgi:hypothetical protein
MIEITGGELFARGLQAEGIEFLFGCRHRRSIRWQRHHRR